MANVSQLFVVLAPKPAPDLFVVDRYVAAATSGNITATLVLNKHDLPIDDELRGGLAAYETAGYRTITCSARAEEGMDALIDASAHQVAALVGQSGVGKSSLVRRLDSAVRGGSRRAGSRRRRPPHDDGVAHVRPAPRRAPHRFAGRA